MRYRLIAIAVLLQTAAILWGTLMVLDGPFATVEDEINPNYVRARKFTELATAGRMQFMDMCAGCHGVAAQGTGDAPALIDRPYSVDFRNAERFHSELSQSIPAHDQILAARDGQGDLDFNALERMSKYLRELRRQRHL